MSKLNPIVSGCRAWAALRDLWRLWCSGVGFGPVRRIPANGSSPRADGGCQIVAERGADTARMEARLQLSSDRIRIRPRKTCTLKIPLPIPLPRCFFRYSDAKIPLPGDTPNRIEQMP
jgi:hypothetical protein